MVKEHSYWGKKNYSYSVRWRVFHIRIIIMGILIRNNLEYYVRELDTLESKNVKLIIIYFISMSSYWSF